MAPKLPSSKIADLRTFLDPDLALSPGGPVRWATVEILYAADQFRPTVSIRVPVPWKKTDTDDQLRALALRYARQLIDHACVAMVPTAPDSESNADLLEGTVLEGLSQELGISEPVTKPRRQREL
jgi:hypothetical protein